MEMGSSEPNHGSHNKLGLEVFLSLLLFIERIPPLHSLWFYFSLMKTLHFSLCTVQCRCVRFIHMRISSLLFASKHLNVFLFRDVRMMKENKILFFSLWQNAKADRIQNGMSVKSIVLYVYLPH